MHCSSTRRGRRPLPWFAALLLAGTAAAAPAPLEPRPLAPAAAGGSGDIVALPGGGWLAATAAGLAVLVDGSYRVLVPGSFESLDLRARTAIAGQTGTLLSAIDGDAGAVRLFLLDPEAGSIAALQTLDYPEAIPDRQCLYRDPENGHVAVFAIDDRGLVTQRYVYDGERRRLVDVAVRRFVGVPEAAACAVDDAAGALFLAEEGVGIWRYDAAAESDPQRTALALRAPHGVLADDVAAIAVDAAGAVWALAGDVYRLSANAVARWPLAAPAPEALAVRSTASGTELALYDEDGAQHASAVLPAAPQTAPRRQRRAALRPSAETAPVRRYGDAADDPAIHVDAQTPAHSRILATDKREGLAVYALDGARTQLLAVGRLNNVDLLPAVAFEDRTVTVAAASNRSRDTIALFTVEDGKVAHLAELPTGLEDVYGLCTYPSATGSYVFINATDGRYEQYRLGGSSAEPSAERVRAFRLPSQPEGCVSDPVTGRVYLGEEAAGIWVAGAEPDGAAPVRAIATGEALVADVEGLAIYRAGARAWLLASSQGSDSYAVYELADGYPLAASFRIVADLAAGIDGVSETDGLAVTGAALPGYPRGLLVVQDGRNRLPDAPQNYKLVDWRRIAVLLSPTAAGGASVTAPLQRGDAAVTGR